MMMIFLKIAKILSKTVSESFCICYPSKKTTNSNKVIKLINLKHIAVMLLPIKKI